MVVLTRRQVASLVHERRQAMADSRFRPENYGEIERVLGVRFAPDLPRVFSQQRAHAASAYLRRLQHDVQRAQHGYYRQLHALPLQIKRMTIHTEDQRSFKSVLVPKLKLPPLLENSPSPRGQPGVSPNTVSPKSVSPKLSANSVSPKLMSPSSITPKMASPGSGSPKSGSPKLWCGSSGSPVGGLGQVVEGEGEGSSYVPHKSFSHHTNTHVHVLFKQMAGSVTPRKSGSVASSVVSGAVSGAVSSVDGKMSRSSHFPVMAAKLSRKTDDAESDSVWSVETPPQPYSFLQLSANQPANRLNNRPTNRPTLPHHKKRLFVNLMPRIERPSPAGDQLIKAQTLKSQSSSPVHSHTVSRKDKNNIPPKVAAALARGGNSSTALYQFVLPSRLPVARPDPGLDQSRHSVMGSRSHFPLTTVHSQPHAVHHMLAISSVQQSNAVQAAV